MAARLEIENQLVIDRPVYRSPEPMHIVYKPDPVCKCGCNKAIGVIELRTHEGEPVASEACFLRIAYKEKWLIKEAV